MLNVPCIPIGEAHRPMSAADLDAQVLGAMDAAMGGGTPACCILEVPHREIGG